jgi:hypothetical protein
MQRLGVEDRLGVENIDLTVRAAVHAAGQETTFGG